MGQFNVNFLTRILLLLVLMANSCLAFASKPISIEVKQFGGDVVFIFYRAKNQINHLRYNNNTNTIYAQFNMPVQHELQNEADFKKFAHNIKYEKKGQVLTFKLKDKLPYKTVINGEKLDAIRFKAQKEEKKPDLSKISAAKNDPGGITLFEKDGEYFVDFYFGKSIPNLAAYRRGRNIWLVFDKKKNFNLDNILRDKNSIFKDAKYIPSDVGAVLRLTLKDNERRLISTVVKKNRWQMALRQNAKAVKAARKGKNIIGFTTRPMLENDSRYLIIGDFKDNTPVIFEDEITGHEVFAVPTRGGKYMQVVKEGVDFNINKTLNGIIIEQKNDQIIITKKDDEVEIAYAESEGEKFIAEGKLFPVDFSKYLKLPTMLPVRNKKLDIIDFNDRRSYLISEASIEPTDADYFAANKALALFYFQHELYHEAIDVFNLMYLQDKESVHQDLQARFLLAVSYTLSGRYDLADEIYDQLTSYVDVASLPEILIWHRYNDYAFGLNPGGIGAGDQINNILSFYSDDKYWPLVLAEIDLALQAGDYKMVEKLINTTRTTKLTKYEQALKYYKASSYRKQKKINVARQLLQELVLDDKDMFIKTRAEFDLLKMRLEKNEINYSDAIDVLNKLKFQWRGDQLEYEILLKLANLYYKNKDITNALRTYQYIQNGYNNKISNFYITSEMAKIFNDVFLKGGASETMDDFVVVALFYEFKELNPIGAAGDDIILSIAKRLVRLDLLDTAAELLRHQIRYRQRGQSRVANADNLANILLINNKPREALLVLDETDGDNFSYSEHQYRSRIRARAAIELQQYLEALELISKDDSPAAEVIRREAIFQDEDWRGFIKLVASDIATLVAELKSNNAARQDILRLAISYYNIGDQNSLNDILAKVKEQGDSNLASTIELLSSSASPVNYRNLDNSLKIDQMEKMLDEFKKSFTADI